jgi:LysR family transcriptional regulator, benzoate and cis,cis-muconate-responsive activator of ben and cat genes
VDVRQMRYFVALAEELHFGRAAQRLHVAQPALSQQIRSLERELGVRLLERTSRGATLTDAGARFLAEASAVVTRFDAAIATMARVRDGELGTLRIGVFPGPVSFFLPRALAELRERVRDVEVVTVALPLGLQEQAVVDGTLDVAFLPWRPKPPLRALTVARERIGVALPADHPLSGVDELDPHALSQLAVVWFARESAPDVYDAVLTKLDAAGGRPRSMLESATPEASLSIVAAGLAASLKTEQEVLRSATGGIQWKPIAGLDLELEVVAAWDPERQSEPVRELLDVLARSHKGNVLSET